MAVSLEDVKVAIDGLVEKPVRLEFVLHPFGKGDLTTDGVQYSTSVSGIDDTYTAVEAEEIITVPKYVLEELEFGLTMRCQSSAAVEAVNWKFQARDPNGIWVDLIAEQTRAASAAAMLDVSASGRVTLEVPGFTGELGSFFVRGVVKSAAAGGETVTAGMKNSSFLICKYRRY